jgi:hypothetical protein
VDYSWNKVSEAAKTTVLLCILATQTLLVWENVIQPRKTLKELEFPLTAAVHECAKERDYQNRVLASANTLHARTSEYLRKSLVVSNEACEQEEMLILQLLSSNVSQAKVDLLKKTAIQTRLD